MSYGYAILYGIIESDIYQTSLNISLPFIHGTSRQHGGLQYDIADIFKPAIIDRLIFRLINKGQIKKNHFVLNDSSVFLSKEGAKLFIEELENTLNKTVLITDKRKMTYRSIIKKEVYKIEKSITEEKIYHGYTMRW